MRPPRPEFLLFTHGKIFDAQFCLPVPINEVEEGDYIEFYRQGTRWRRVKYVKRGRKHNFVQFHPCRANPFKNQRVNLIDIKSVWRPQPTLELWEESHANNTPDQVPLPDPRPNREPDEEREQRCALPAVCEGKKKKKKASKSTAKGGKTRRVRKSRKRG